MILQVDVPVPIFASTVFVEELEFIPVLRATAWRLPVLVQKLFVDGLALLRAHTALINKRLLLGYHLIDGIRAHLLVWV